MKLLTVLAATAVAAAVAAALSLSAGADPSAGDKATKLATCLHARGATDAPSGADALALRQWLAAHTDNAAVIACKPRPTPPTALISCLRAHGLNPPDNLFELKPWMLRQARTDAGKTALSACGVDISPPQSAATGKDLSACLRSNGAGVPAGATGLALKTWVRDHSSDANVMRALKLCGGGLEKVCRCGSAPGRQSRSVPLAAYDSALRSPPFDDEVVRWRPYAGEHDIVYVDAETIGGLFRSSGELDRAS